MEGKEFLRTWAADQTGDRKGHHSCEEKEEQRTAEIRDGNLPKIRERSGGKRKKRTINKEIHLRRDSSQVPAEK